MRWYDYEPDEQMFELLDISFVRRMVPLATLKIIESDELMTKLYRNLMQSNTPLPRITVENGVVLDGNHRAKAALELGETEIGAYVIQDSNAKLMQEISRKHS